MRGRPAQPLELLKLKGATKKNPARYRERMQAAPDMRSVGDPPPEFLIQSPGMGFQKAERLLAIWKRLLADAPPGCIMRRHRQDLMNACKLQYDMDHGPATPAMHGMMRRYLTSFGMTGEWRGAGQGGKDVPPPGESEESGWKAFAREDKASRAG